MSMTSNYKLGLLVAAAILAVLATLALGHARSGVSQAGGGGGALSVDCNASVSGVQTNCTYPPGSTFSIQVHATALPSGGLYYGFQVKPVWTAGILNYLPNANPANEAIWPDCDIQARADNQPAEPSFVYGCVPFNPTYPGSNYLGALVQFQMECKSGAGGSSPIDLAPFETDPQGGTHYVSSIGTQVSGTTLNSATVNCAVPPTPTFTNTPTDTATPTPCPGGICPTDTPTNTPPTGPSPTGSVVPATITPTCAVPLDIVNVLDGSASIASSDFALMQQFAKDLSAHFDISAANAHVGVVQFSSQGDGKVEIGLSDDAAAIAAAIDAMVQLAGITDIEEGITIGQSELDANGRAGVPHVLLVLTDGMQTDAGDPGAAADAARSADTEVFAIGVGLFVDQNELNSIASDPDAEHVFLVDDFSDLPTVLDAIANAICGAATPSAFPRTGDGSGGVGGATQWVIVAGLLAAAAAGLGLYGWRYARSR